MIDDAGSGEPDDERKERRRPLGVLAAVRTATAQFAELTGKRPESPTSVDRTEHGWRVVFEVVELERVPATTSVLASYEAEVDEEGTLLGYGRLRRYYRNQADPE